MRRNGDGMKEYEIRTDLALEETERFEGDGWEIKGVRVEEDFDEERLITTTVVYIETEQGAKAMGKPMGCYITLEAPAMDENDEEYHREISECVAAQIERLLPCTPDKKILVVGLGNREVTPDSLGPLVVDNLFVTRHLIREYGQSLFGDNGYCQISSVAPGVMAQTGMETSEIIQGIVETTKPDALVVIDALAARNTGRLSRTIQITDAGIHPGSGVGNYRNAITEETMGIPVISLGVPTVVDAATIVKDTMDNLLSALNQGKLEGVKDVYKDFGEEEQYQLIRELLAPSLHTMYVTPKNMDETVKRLSFTISEALNIAFAG